MAGGENGQKTGRQSRKPANRSNSAKGGKTSLKSRGFKGPSAQNPRRAYGHKAHGAVTAPKSPKSRRQSASNNGGWLWGTHACLAALSNPKRTVHNIMITEAAATRLKLPSLATPAQITTPQELDKALPRGAVHQGIAIKAAPLEWPDLEIIADSAPDDGLILVLDQITDPQNVGAMIRLASAFGVSALVMQTRKAPPLSGALAKVAVGCLETVPVCLETNIAVTLQNLQRIGWQVTGLAGETDMSVAQALSGGGKRVIVMGAEGPGLRELVRKRCDQLARIPMVSRPDSQAASLGHAESLNVATAAAIALYAARQG